MSEKELYEIESKRIKLSVLTRFFSQLQNSIICYVLFKNFNCKRIEISICLTLHTPKKSKIVNKNLFV